MKFFVLIGAIAITFSAQSFAAVVKDSSISRDEQIFTENQEKIKKTYLENKANAEKRLSRKTNSIVSKSNILKRSLKQSAGCEGLGCKWQATKSNFVHIEQKIFHWFQNLNVFAYSRFLVLKSKFISGSRVVLAKLPFSFEGKPLSVPPTVPAIYQQKNTSGSRPLIGFEAEDVIADPDGTVETITWDFGDGTSQTFQASELNEYGYVEHIYPFPAHYVVKLTVTDNDNDSTTSSVYADVTTNQIPLPTFTVDTNSGASPLTVTFTGTGTDAEDSYVEYSWRFGDGTRGTSDSGSPQIVHEYTDPGTYNVRLVMTDSAGARGMVQAQIFVDDTPPSEGGVPSIVFDSSDIAGQGPNLVSFDVSKSFDIDGTIASYEWDFGDFDSFSNYASGPTPTHVYERPGTYVGVVRVYDTAGGMAERYFLVFVEGATPLNSEIIAYQWGSSREISFEGNITALRSPVSSQFMWDFGDGESGTGSYMNHTYAADGTYNVTLKSHDVFGNNHTTTKSITVTDVNDSPQANLNVDNDRPEMSQTVTFQGGSSSDPGQSLPLSYRFDFGDGAIDTSSDEVNHAYEETGLYHSDLFVTNSRGISANASVIISVRDGSSVPMANFIYSPMVGAAPLTVDLDASKSSSAGATIVSYMWKDGRNLISQNAVTSYELSDPGYYFLDLVVKDSNGNYDIQTRPIIVFDGASVPSGNAAPVATFTSTADPSNSRIYNFDANGSTDSNGDQMFYEWRVNGSVVGNLQDFQYKFPESNIYQVELTVYDQWGASDTYAQTVDLSSVSQAQLAFDYSPIKPIISESVKFGAENSIIPGSTIVSYSWDFGDSSSGTGISPTHVYTSAGTYSVTLTLTDSNSNTFTVSKSVVVASANANPVLRLTARDVDMLTEVTNSGTYKGTSFPETVYLSVRSTANSNRFIKDAVWDFGDGQTGFGADVEYTYTKPGTYTVSVTGYDANNLSATASLAIVVPADCKRLEGETECLNIPAIANNVLPFSVNTWTISRTGNFASASKYFPKNWIHLKALDGSDEVVDLSQAATVSSNTVAISKQKLIDQNINFARPYKLVVNTVDSSASPILSEMPMIYFGAGKMQITTSESNVRLQVNNPSAQYKKFIDMGVSNSLSLSDLPLGPTVIIAEKGDRREILNVKLKANSVEAVSIDLPTLAKQRKLANLQKAKGQKNFAKSWKQREMWAQGSKNTGKQSLTTSWPAWAHGLCGEEPPFSEVKDRNLSMNQTPIWAFSSSNPSEQNSLREIPAIVNRPVRLSCGISSESLMYGYNRWKYKDGPQRCWEDLKAHWYWDWYLKNLKYEDDVVSIRYEVQDAWTGESFKNVIVTSANSMRQKMGRELTDITQRVGVPTVNDKEWAYRQNFDLYIPPHFKRPKISFELSSSNSALDKDFYSVNCDVISTEDSQPKAIQLKATSLNHATDRMIRNAQYSLQNRYKYFPVHYDGRATGAVNLDGDAGKAEYELSIRYYNQSETTWTGVDVEYTYAGVSHTESYTFTGTPVVDTEQGIYKNTFVIDTAALVGAFGWVSGKDRIQLKVTPKGLDFDSNPILGKPMTEQFVALFDVQTIEADQSIAICSNGYFGSNFSTFAQDGLIQSMTLSTTAGLGFRCNNISLPFGGPFDVSGLTQDTYRHGQMVKTRTFNESNTSQDDYDGSAATLRKSDLDDYTAFSSAALTISQITNPTVGGVPTDKQKILDFCKPSGAEPKFPCTSATQFTDIDQDMVMQICQWYSNSGAEIAGCPTDFLPQVIRFSKWVKKNAADLAVAQNMLLKPTLSSGRHFGSDYTAVQSTALAYGIWPDGKPIWDVSTSGTELTNKRVMACHEKMNGCETLKAAFKNDNYYVDAMELINGWRL